MTVVPPPDVEVTVSPSRIAEGQSATVSWTITGASGGVLNGGRFNNEPVGTSGSLSTGSLDESETYTVTASNTVNGVTQTGSDSDGVTVVPAPEVSVTVSPSRIAEGQSATVSWTITGASGGVLNGGRFNNEPVGTSGSLSTGSLDESETYTVSASNTVNGVTQTRSDSATVTVVPPPDVEVTVSPSRIAEGQSATVSWTITGASGGVLNGGRFNNEPVGTSGSLSTGSLDESETYTVTASNTVNGVTQTGSDSDGVTVVPAPEVSVTVSPSRIAEGQSATVSWTITGASGGVLNGGRFNNEPVGTSGSLSTGSLDESETYTVTASNTVNGVTQTRSDSATVTVVPPPDVEVTVSETSIEEGQDVTVSWTINGALGGTLTSNHGMNVDVGASGDTILRPAVTTTYTVTARNTVNGATQTGSDSETVTVVPPPPPDVFVEVNPDSIPAGGTATVRWEITGAPGGTLVGGELDQSVGASGSEIVSPDSSVTYTVSATNSGGSDSDSAYLKVVHPPDIMFSATPATIYRGESSTLEWKIDRADEASIEDIGPISLPEGRQVVRPSAPTTYRLDATGFGGPATATARVSVNPNDDPVAAFNVSCANRACQFDASPSTNTIGTTSYSWDLGDGNADSGIEVFHTYASSYDSVHVTLTVSDQYGLSDRESMTLVFHDELFRAGNAAPSADFTADCNGLECTFTSTSTDDTGIDSYLWSTGDGSAAGTASVHEHTYGSAGTYTVTLVVRDGHGGLGAALYQIQVGDP